MADQHKVLRTADGRVIDFAFGDTGFDTPARLTAKQTANAGSVIETFAGDLPDNIQRGFAIDAAGAVSAPSMETTNEQLEARRTMVGEWVLQNGGTTGFLHYATFQNNAKARVWEAVQRMAYLRTHADTVLSNEAHWGKIAALIAIGWTDFVPLVDPAASAWTTTLLDGMRAGTSWRLIQPGTNGNYLPVVDASPPPYTTLPAHHRAYESLLASARV